MTKYLRTVLLLFLVFMFCGWGNSGHKLINNKCVFGFPSEMASFRQWQQQLEEHAPDADARKSTDPNESPKHYIDIDNYPEFVNTGSILQNFDSIVAVHGYTFVLDQGILPWAILTTVDSLKQTFIRKDWDKAILFAADLGHYVADAHMPLHITKNYNGQLTGQTGIHSRYESNMIGRYLTDLGSYTPDSASYINDLPGYVFGFIYENYEYVDSVLSADQQAKSIAGSTTSDLYYQKLWEFSGGFTKNLFKNASFRISELIYTAWVLAGKPSIISSIGDPDLAAGDFQLYQNYPNPFNPVTLIRYRIDTGGDISLKIYTPEGQLISEPLHETEDAGIHEIRFDGSELASGVYFYRLSTASQTTVRKMLLLK